MKVTYQKRDGSILERYRNTTPPYRIGDYTSMGWKLLNIEYCYKDKLYTEIEYYKMIEKSGYEVPIDFFFFLCFDHR